MKSIVRSSAVLLAAILLAACNLPAKQTLSEPGLTHSWIDAPLDGSTLPLAPVEVVAHAADLGGISQIEFSVNEAVIALNASPDSSQTLVTMKQTWTPNAPGVYTLKVRAQNNGGAWGDYAAVVVTIGEEAIQGETIRTAALRGVVVADLNGNGSVDENEGPLDGAVVSVGGCASASATTGSDGFFEFASLPAGICSLDVSKGGWIFTASIPSLGYPISIALDPSSESVVRILMAPVMELLPTETSAPLPTATSAPLPTATSTPLPTATSAPLPTATTPPTISVTRLSTNTVYYESNACGPKEVTILVQASDPAGVEVVVLFYRLQNQASGETTNWFQRAMIPIGGGLYEITINPEAEIISQVGFPGAGEGWLQYQAVLQNSQGDSSTRTPLLSDITVVGCG